MEGHCSTGQSPQWAVVPVEEKEQEEDCSSRDGSHPTLQSNQMTVLQFVSSHVQPKRTVGGLLVTAWASRCFVTIIFTLS